VSHEQQQYRQGSTSMMNAGKGRDGSKGSEAIRFGNRRVACMRVQTFVDMQCMTETTNLSIASTKARKQKITLVAISIRRVREPMS